MNAEFFGLAILAALNAKLLALDLLLIENRRPRLMFICILAGGLSMAIAVGLADVLFVHADSVKLQNKPSAGVDLALGLVLLLAGGLLITGALPRHRSAAAGGQSAKKDSWARRALAEPRAGLAFGIGTLCGLPAAAYLAALHNLIAGKYSTATQVVAVIVFSVIEFLLVIVPWLCLELWPDRTAELLRRGQAWIGGHAKQFMAWIAILLSAYLTISALVRLL